ncbi:MAG: F0F1 ATP synthase subunit B [Patescibacteria group bacterium]
MGELFDTFGIDVRLLIIQAVNFGITLVVLWYFLYRPLLRVIGERKEKIAKGIVDAEAAETLRTETEGARAGVLSQAERDAQGLVERATLEGKDERAKIIKTAQDRSDAMLADAKKESIEMQRRALAESEKEMTRLAILAAEKILRKQS